MTGEYDEKKTTVSETASSETITENEEVQGEQNVSEDSRILIAYFSMPEDVDTENVDALAGVSLVVSDGEKLGNTEYVAKLIQQTIGGDLFRIETEEEYPLSHDPLVDQASEEKSENARPKLSSKVGNFEQYETILLGYPNWCIGSEIRQRAAFT